MIPSVEHIIKKRHHNRRRLRFMALILVLIGIIAACWALLSFLFVADQTWTTAMPLVAFAAGFIVPAIPLWLFDNRISRALVPMPKLECPGCRYSMIGLVRPVCPECGLELPESYVKPPPG